MEITVNVKWLRKIPFWVAIPATTFILWPILWQFGWVILKFLWTYLTLGVTANSAGELFVPLSWVLVTLMSMVWWDCFGCDWWRNRK